MTLVEACAFMWHQLITAFALESNLAVLLEERKGGVQKVPRLRTAEKTVKVGQEHQRMPGSARQQAGVAKGRDYILLGASMPNIANPAFRMSAYTATSPARCFSYSLPTT